MSLNESIVEDAALEWFGDPPTRALRRTGLGYALGHRPHLAPGEPAAESACALHADRRESFGEVVLAGRLRESIRRLNPAIPFRTLATLRDTLLPKLLSGELSLPAKALAQAVVAALEAKAEAAR